MDFDLGFCLSILFQWIYEYHWIGRGHLRNHEILPSTIEFSNPMNDPIPYCPLSKAWWNGEPGIRG